MEKIDFFVGDLEKNLKNKIINDFFYLKQDSISEKINEKELSLSFKFFLLGIKHFKNGDLLIAKESFLESYFLERNWQTIYFLIEISEQTENYKSLQDFLKILGNFLEELKEEPFFYAKYLLLKEKLSENVLEKLEIEEEKKLELKSGIALQKKQYVDLLCYYDDILEKNPENKKILISKMSLFLSLEKIESFLFLANKVFTLNLNNFETNLVLQNFWCFYNLLPKKTKQQFENFNLLIEKTEIFLEKNPFFNNLNYYLANYYLDNKQDFLALKFFEKIPENHFFYSFVQTKIKTLEKRLKIKKYDDKIKKKLIEEKKAEKLAEIDPKIRDFFKSKNIKKYKFLLKLDFQIRKMFRLKNYTETKKLCEEYLTFSKTNKRVNIILKYIQESEKNIFPYSLNFSEISNNLKAWTNLFNNLFNKTLEKD